ncbi:hypothetical protein GJ744_001595 [Endocarpon pusillum]|uniref:Uncharacterized protein n=1 Tax=Endocarpon pusillum TaxID=364733 RepID=A0A8H7A9E6_9EURO|nr:hypothetical protein GJ744_001595 [Endocarpon pusillum]
MRVSARYAPLNAGAIQGKGQASGFPSRFNDFRPDWATATQLGFYFVAASVRILQMNHGE